jgi:integrase
MRTLRLLVRTARRIDPTIASNPVDAIRIPVPAPREVPPLDLAAWWAKTESLSPQMRRIHRLFLLSGARRSSVLLMRRTDVDLDAGTVTFRHMKVGKPLTVPVGPHVASMLREHLGETAPLSSEWLWPSESGAGHVVEPNRKGLPGPHALRHVARSLLIASSCPYAESAILLGHSLGGGATANYVHAPMLLASLRPHVERYEEYVLGQVARGAVTVSTGAPMAAESSVP